jgi:hypothetical protein
MKESHILCPQASTSWPSLWNNAQTAEALGILGDGLNASALGDEILGTRGGMLWFGYKMFSKNACV